MNRRTCTIILTVAALATPLTATAGGYDPLRCQAVALRKEAQLYECLGRCQRRSERRGDRSGGAPDARLLGCQDGCEQRFEAALNQLRQPDICDAAGQPAARRSATLPRVRRNGSL